MKEKIKKTSKNFLAILKKPEMRILPGQISYFFLMSFIPIIAIIALIASYVTKNFDIVNTLRQILPGNLEDTIIPLLLTNESNINLILFALLSFFVASNGPRAIIVAANSIYKVDNQKYITVFIKSLIMTFIIILLLLFMILIPVFGDTIVNLILKTMGNPSSLYQYVPIYKFLKILVSFLIIIFNIKLLYTMAPNKKIKSNTTTKGALFTTFGWIIATEIFSFYITSIADYKLLYGNFANVLVLLIWIYLIADLFIIGMAINVSEEEKESIKK